MQPQVGLLAQMQTSHRSYAALKEHLLLLLHDGGQHRMQAAIQSMVPSTPGICAAEHNHAAVLLFLQAYRARYPTAWAISHFCGEQQQQ
jgi:hypothetical protein